MAIPGDDVEIDCRGCPVQDDFDIEGSCLKKVCPLSGLLREVKFGKIQIWDGQCFLPKGIVCKYIKIK
jgi:hypothetical protein